MKRHSVILILVAIISSLSWAYSYHSPPSKTDGTIANINSIKGASNLKKYLEDILSAQNTTDVAYKRALTVLNRAENNDIYLEAIKDASNLSHTMIGKKRYSMMISIGENVDVSMVIILDENNKTNLQSFSITTT